MAMEMRQELKLSQQLVMTPQLQQAIRLLQLSRMELADLVHEEMLEIEHDRTLVEATLRSLADRGLMSAQRGPFAGHAALAHGWDAGRLARVRGRLVGCDP